MCIYVCPYVFLHISVARVDANLIATHGLTPEQVRYIYNYKVHVCTYLCLYSYYICLYVYVSIYKHAELYIAPFLSSLPTWLRHTGWRQSRWCIYIIIKCMYAHICVYIPIIYVYMSYVYIYKHAELYIAPFLWLLPSFIATHGLTPEQVIYEYMYTCIYMSIYIFVHIYVYICMPICIFTYLRCSRRCLPYCDTRADARAGDVSI